MNNTYSVRVENLPDYASEYRFITVTLSDNKLWFYGAYNNHIEACRVASEIDGIVLAR